MVTNMSFCCSETSITLHMIQFKKECWCVFILWLWFLWLCLLNKIVCIVCVFTGSLQRHWAMYRNETLTDGLNTNTPLMILVSLSSCCVLAAIK